MTTPALQSWLPWLRDRAQDDLSRAALAAGFAAGPRTATNLVLLDEQLGDPGLVVTVAADALRAADPDLALNNLERLCGVASAAILVGLLGDATRRRQLLTILGASPFLSRPAAEEGGQERGSTEDGE